MCSNFAQRSSHKDSANFIANQKLCDIVWVSPHHSKLLRSSVTIKFSDAVWITNSHNIEDTIESRADTFAILIPDFEQFLPFTVHDHAASISKHTLNEQIFI
jgi:hypothetical protein